MSDPNLISYILAAIAVPVVLHFHLLPALFAGLAVHVLTVKLARKLPAHLSRMARGLSLALIAVTVIAGLFGIGLGLWSLLHGKDGIDALLASAAGVLAKLKEQLPADVADTLPGNLEELQEQISALVSEHGQRLSAFGMAGFKTVAHILLGMVVGGLTSIHAFEKPSKRPPFSRALHTRILTLLDAFDKVVFAQVQISALNTLLTAIYLAIVLPLFGIHLPMLTILIPLTFLVGLLPVVGNLISNTVIVVISLGTSPGVALASLTFLVLIHKLEYFTNARIVGGKVQASAWELLCAILTLEAVFGLPGLVAAPVVYAWLKAEIKARDLI